MVVGSMTVETDVVIVGAGPGGYVAALRAAQLGLDVLVVEKAKRYGGVCLLHGCIPTKALISASTFVDQLSSASDFGVTVEGHSVDPARMFAWKDSVVSQLENGIRTLFKQRGVEVIEGTGVFKDAHTLHVRGKSDVNAITFKHAIVATGSSPIELPFARFDGEKILNSRQALSMNEIPKRLAIIGGGYIGTEMATVYGKLGCEVTIIEASDRLVPVIDEELVAPVAAKLTNHHVTTLLSAKASAVDTKGDGVRITYEQNGEQGSLEADKLLVVVGRKPNAKGFGLEEIGVALDEHGFVTTDDQLRSSLPHILAIGDVQGQPMLAHKAMRQAKVAAEVIAGQASAFDNKVIPSVVFNDPELMSVGHTEASAKAAGYETVAARYPYKAIGKALIERAPDGFMLIVAQKDTGIVLGIHAAGPHASELAGEAALAIELGSTVEDLRLTIHPHPTLSEIVPETANELWTKFFDPK